MIQPALVQFRDASLGIAQSSRKNFQSKAGVVRHSNRRISDARVITRFAVQSQSKANYCTAAIKHFAIIEKNVRLRAISPVAKGNGFIYYKINVLTMALVNYLQIEKDENSAADRCVLESCHLMENASGAILTSGTIGRNPMTVQLRMHSPTVSKSKKTITGRIGIVCEQNPHLGITISPPPYNNQSLLLEHAENLAKNGKTLADDFLAAIIRESQASFRSLLKKIRECFVPGEPAAIWLPKPTLIIDRELNH